MPKLTRKKWFKGLVSAAVSGAAMAVPLVIVDPQGFNPQENLGRLATVTGFAALIGIANYLKQSPLWQDDDEEG